MGIDVYYLAENTLYKLETEKNESEKLIDMYIDNEQSLICKKLDDEYRTYYIISKNTDVSNSTSYRWYLSSMKHRWSRNHSNDFWQVYSYQWWNQWRGKLSEQSWIYEEAALEWNNTGGLSQLYWEDN